MNGAPNTLADSEDFEFQALGEAKNYRTALLREFGGHLRGNVIEVGAGIGQLTAELRRMPSIQKLCPIEPNVGFCDRIRASFPDHDLIAGTISDLKERAGWNAILSVNVLEHIEADQAELATYAQLLEPTGGSLCLFVPARREIYAPIDRDFGHFRRYVRRELRKKLEQAGFIVDRLRYYNLVGYFAWWMTFCVLKKRSFDPQAVRFFDRAIFPAVHWTETHVSAPPFGQSLLAIARARKSHAR
jgi:SAM-dependent methyltransferase